MVCYCYVMCNMLCEKRVMKCVNTMVLLCYVIKMLCYVKIFCEQELWNEEMLGYVKMSRCYVVVTLCDKWYVIVM
jgi:hypothetical protein